MADLRLREIGNQLIDLQGRLRYGVELLNNVSNRVQSGDSFQVGDIDELTVVADGATTGNSAQAPSLNALTLTVDKRPTIFVSIPKMDADQLLEGNWAANLAREAMTRMRNYVDDEVLSEYCARTLAYDATGTYHDNPGGADATGDEFLAACAALEDRGGATPEAIAIMINPYARASLKRIPGFIEQVASLNGALGIPQIGSLHGYPVYTTQSIKRRRSVTVLTSAVVAAGTLTLTGVATGHGIVPGMKLSLAGTAFLANAELAKITQANPATVLTSATNVITASVTGVGAATVSQASSCTVEQCENLVLDTSKVHFAMQRMMDLEIIPVPGTTNDELRVYSHYGRIGRTGWCRVVGTPPKVKN